MLYAKLNEETPLCAKLSNDTRWASDYAMLKHQVVLLAFVCKLDDMDFEDVLLAAFFERGIDMLLTKLEELNKVVLRLQLHSCTIYQTREYFDSVLDVFTTV